MRILQITDNISKNSGVSSVIMNLYRGMDRERIQFDFLVMNCVENSYEKEIREMGGEVYYVASPLVLANLLVSRKEINNFFKKYSSKYKTIHLHTPTLAFFTLRIAKKYNIKNRIVHSHSTMFSLSKLKSIIHFILLINLKRDANIYWACSDKAAEFLYGKKYLRDQKVQIINNAINCNPYKFNLDIRKEYRDRFGLNGKFVIGNVARFNNIKNHKFMIEVIEKISEIDKNIMLLLIGDGEEKEKILELIKLKGLEKQVVCLGFRKDIYNILQCVDTFILPSLKEGLPVVAVEAQASGLPCYLSKNITKEVNLGGVQYLDLDVDIWVDKLKNKVFNEKREEVFAEFKKSKFNIENEALRVQNIYIKLNESNME